MSENYYFEVVVYYKTESDDGKIKNVKEIYLVTAVSVVDVEAKITKEFMSLPNEWWIDKVAVKKYHKIIS